MRLRYVLLLTILFILVSCFLSSDEDHAFASLLSSQPLQPGFCATLGGAPIEYSSPVIGELDNDDELEIIVAGSDGWVYAINDDGSLLWQYNVITDIDAVSYQMGGKTGIASTPAIADLDLDGFQEVVIGVGMDTDVLGHNGGMIVLDHNGHLYPGWPQVTLDVYANGFSDGIWSSPALGDLDGDGDLEIVAGSFDQRVYVWHHDGRLMQGWPQYVEDTGWSSPALADIDKDGYLNIIIGTDHFGASGGYLRVYKPNGEELSGYPKLIDQALYSSPAVTDLDGDGWLDIVTGTGNFFENRGYAIYAWDHNGMLLPGWPVATDSYVLSSPSIGDMDGDGQPEVVVGTQGGKIYALNADGSSVPGWPVQALDSFANQGPINFTSANFANFDADTIPEVMVVHYGNVIVIDQDGTYLTYNAGDPDQGKPSMYIPYGGFNTAAVADIDADGTMEIIHVGGSHFPDGGNAYVCAWKMTVASVTSPWPMFRATPKHTATLLPTLERDSAVVSHNIADIMLPDQVYNFTVTMKNTGTTAWTSSGQYRLAALPGDSLASVESVGLDAGETIVSGESKSFTITIHTPSVSGLYMTQWRMVDADGNGFGKVAMQKVKVGNEPALYVLATDTLGTHNGVYPVGVAPAIEPSPYLVDWQSVKSLGFSAQRADGYFIMDAHGSIYFGGTIDSVGSNHPWDPDDYQEIIALRHGTGYHVINRYGEIFASNGANVFSPAPPAFTQPIVRSAAVTADDRGIYVLDGNGNVYTGGNALVLTPATPNFGIDIAKRIKLTADGMGYYVLDAYGRVWNGGTAPAITANYVYHIGEDWARDFELTANELGYYLLDKEGRIHTGGEARPPTINLSPFWAGQDVALDLALADNRILDDPFLAVSSENIYQMSEFDDSLPSTNIVLLNGGSEETLTWTTSVVNGAEWLSVTPTSGDTPGTLKISSKTLQPIGMYNGTVRLTSTNPADGSEIQRDINVTWSVVENIYKVHLPLSIRQ